MEHRKLILPAEIKVCATCSFWDGERHIDGDVRVVVVADNCEGECLIKGEFRQGLHGTRLEPDCMWEDLEPDEVPPDGGDAMVSGRLLS